MFLELCLWRPTFKPRLTSISIWERASPIASGKSRRRTSSLGFWPFGLPSAWTFPEVLTGLGFLAAKLVLLSCAVVLVETTNAKMRLFRVPELMAVAFTLAALSTVAMAQGSTAAPRDPRAVTEMRGVWLATVDKMEGMLAGIADREGAE